MTFKRVAVDEGKRLENGAEAGGVTAAKPFFRNVCFEIEPKGWAMRGFFNYLDGRMPPTDAELLRVSGRADKPGRYVFFSYDQKLVFTKLFEELDDEGYFALAEGSGSVVVKREVCVSDKSA